MGRPEIAGALALTLLYVCADKPKADEYMKECNQPQNYEQLQDQPRFVMFLPGSGATNKGNRAVFADLAEKYGVDNVKVYNSTVSPEGPGTERFEAMGELIKGKIEKGTRVSIIAHSSGTAEFKIAIGEIEKKQPSFFDRLENAKKMDLTLISPTGVFEGTRGAFGYVGRIYKMISEEQPFPIISRESELRGVMSVNTFPPENIERQEMVMGLREALPGLSQHKEGIQELDYKPGREYNSHLPEDIKLQLDGLDRQLKEAIDKKDGIKIKALLRQRGEVTKTELGEVYGGSDRYFDDKYSGDFGWTVPALLGTIRTIGGIFNSESTKKIIELKGKGVKVQVIVPEYDVTLPLSDVQKYFCDDDIKQLPLSTHVSPFASQPNIFIEALKPSN